MSVRRTELPHASWTPLRNCWLRDKRVSYKAKGLLGYLLSHSVGYDVTQRQMIADSDDGRAAVVSGLGELEEAGYLTRTRQVREGGRFGEYDYELADPFDADGRLLTSVENRHTTKTSAAPSAADAENQHTGAQGEGQMTLTSVDYPLRETAPIEDQREKTTKELPAPPLRAVAGDGGQTINQRAQTLAREHYDACGGMASVPAVMNIVKRALAATLDGKPRYTDQQARDALALLRTTSRPVTLQTMRAALEAPATVTGNGYRPAQQGPYRDRPADDYRTGF